MAKRLSVAGGQVGRDVSALGSGAPGQSLRALPGPADCSAQIPEWTWFLGRVLVFWSDECLIQPQIGPSHFPHTYFIQGDLQSKCSWLENTQNCLFPASSTVTLCSHDGGGGAVVMQCPRALTGNRSSPQWQLLRSWKLEVGITKRGAFRGGVLCSPLEAGLPLALGPWVRGRGADGGTGGRPELPEQGAVKCPLLPRPLPALPLIIFKLVIRPGSDILDLNQV